MVGDSLVGSPAFQAGISSGMRVIGVNGRVYTPERLAEAVKNSKDSKEPITLLIVSDDYIHTCTIDYHGGPRYAHLDRDASKPDYLDELIKPRAGAQ
jgi:predicted metalloprotease with PDZ domain